MSSFLHRFFHNETNDRTEGGAVYIPKNKEEWPEEWKKIEYKRYARYRSIMLPNGNPKLFRDYLSRRQSRGVLENKVTFKALSDILFCGYGIQNASSNGERKECRTVPSAGQRYPLEIYVFLFKDVESCLSGIYHYSVREHSLEPVVRRAFSKEEISMLVGADWLVGSAGMVCMTAVFHRTINKYGSRGYRFILLEAGHVAQNMLLAGTELGVRIIPIGGVNEESVEKMMDLGSGGDERVVYTLFF